MVGRDKELQDPVYLYMNEYHMNGGHQIIPDVGVNMSEKIEHDSRGELNGEGDRVWSKYAYSVPDCIGPYKCHSDRNFHIGHKDNANLYATGIP